MKGFLAKVESITRRIGNRKFTLYGLATRSPPNIRCLNVSLVVASLVVAALNPKSTMGTVIHATQLGRIESMLTRKSPNARITVGGTKMSGTSPLDGFDLSQSGSFFAPTVVEGVEVADELWQEEVFGPVIVVKRFKVRRYQATLSCSVSRHVFLTHDSVRER